MAHRPSHRDAGRRVLARVADLSLPGAMLLLALPGLAMAQTPPRSVQPSQILQPAQTLSESQSQRREIERRQNEIAPIPEIAPALKAASVDRTPLFTLDRVVLTGATALSAGELAETYRGYLGRPVSQDDLLAIASAISEAYRRAGYHLSRAIIPPQTPKRGELTVQVIEGAITEVVIKGEPSPAFGLDALLGDVTAEQPSRLSTLERRLLLANDRPGVRIADTALDEIETGSGRFRLSVTAQAWRVQATVGLDNGGSAAVGPWQTSAAVSLNSILIPGDTVSFAGSTVPNASRELRFAKASYDVPLGLDAVRIGAAASRSEVWPGDERRQIRSASRSESYELRAAFAPVMTQLQSLWLTGSLGISDIEERNLFGEVFNDRIRFATLSADYKLHATEGSWTYISTTLRKGLGAYDDRDGTSALSRQDASPYFTVLNAALTHYQNITGNWSLKLAAAGQISSGPLLTSQQFYLGGSAFGRGFESGWLSGDNGIAGSVELRYDKALGFDLLKGYQLYAFVEGGVTRSQYQPKDLVQGLATAGLGARLFVTDDLQLGISVARPITSHSPVPWDRGATVLFSLTNAVRLCPERSDLRCG